MCAIWCIALFWWLCESFHVSAFEHMASRCSQVSMALLGHKMQFGFGCVIGQIFLLQWLPII